METDSEAAARDGVRSCVSAATMGKDCPVPKRNCYKQEEFFFHLPLICCFNILDEFRLPQISQRLTDAQVVWKTEPRKGFRLSSCTLWLTIPSPPTFT